ncbi:MAG: DUF4262 domain-containing protein [Candidatus Lambdaproteobacteria bacterium]|nr:DUF4262 domain-containing protein [Candidatus Lambdaproteobacteria bacterium]
MHPIRVDSISSLLVHVSRQIHEFGWALIVTPYGDYLHHYTLGLPLRWRHQDLETFALDEERGSAYLTALVQRIQDGMRYRNGDFVSDLAAGYDLFLVENPCDPEGAPMTSGRLRLVWPDAHYRYPWHQGCERRCAAQAFIPPPSDVELQHLHCQLGVLGAVN